MSFWDSAAGERFRAAVRKLKVAAAEFTAAVEEMPDIPLKAMVLDFATGARIFGAMPDFGGPGPVEFPTTPSDN